MIIDVIFQEIHAVCQSMILSLSNAVLDYRISEEVSLKGCGCNLPGDSSEKDTLAVPRELLSGKESIVLI